MKKFSLTLDAVTMTKDNHVLNHEKIPMSVFAEDRGGALLAGLDVGQALSRSTNASKGEISTFFRVIGLTEEIGA